MITSMMRRAMISGYLNGPKLFGSNRSAQFMRDLASGSDSLDIVFVGDSNTGSSVTGFWGYHNGMSEALNARSYTMYGTQYSHLMTDWLVNTNTGGWRGSGFVYQPNGTLKNGSIDGTGTAYNDWKPGVDFVRYGSAGASPPARDSWAYLAAGTAEYWNWYPQIYIETSHPLFGNSLTLFHRIRYGDFNSGSGYFRPAVRNFGGSTIATSAVVNTNTGASYKFNGHEYSFTSGGSAQLEAAPFAGGTVAGSRGGVGPVALHGHSLYAKRKGWAVHSHGYLAGFDTTSIKNVITGVNSTLLRSHLEELRNRQISAGGSGRVLLIAHSGINGADTTSSWTEGHQAIWDTYKAAWTHWGYPESDLAMISFVGVQANSADTSNGAASLPPIREAAKSWAFTNSGVTVAHMPAIISYSELIGPPYLYQSGSTGSVHLSGGTGSTTDGYREVANRLITALLG